MTVQSEVGQTSQESDSPAGAVASSELAVGVGVGPGVDVGAVDRAQGALQCSPWAGLAHGPMGRAGLRAGPGLKFRDFNGLWAGPG